MKGTSAAPMTNSRFMDAARMSSNDRTRNGVSIAKLNWHPDVQFEARFPLEPTFTSNTPVRTLPLILTWTQSRYAPGFGNA